MEKITIDFWQLVITDPMFHWVKVIEIG
jgi:hypothetical protein